MKRIIAALGLLLFCAVLAIPGSAQASAEECTSVTVSGRVSPDSGHHGTWATTTLDRKLKVCAVVTPTEGDWTYRAVVDDKGTFVTEPGGSPNDGVELKGGFKGDVVGGFTATFSAPKWDGSLTKPGASTSTPGWVAKAFPGAKFDEKGPVADWSWTYTTCSERWVNAAPPDGDSGDITEKVCPTNPPTTPPATPPATAPAGGGSHPTPSVSASPVTVQAQLPVTGSRFPLWGAIGLALCVCVAGMALLYLHDRMNRKRFEA